MKAIHFAPKTIFLLIFLFCMFVIIKCVFVDVTNCKTEHVRKAIKQNILSNSLDIKK